MLLIESKLNVITIFTVFISDPDPQRGGEKHSDTELCHYFVLLAQPMLTTVYLGYGFDFAKILDTRSARQGRVRTPTIRGMQDSAE